MRRLLFLAALLLPLSALAQGVPNTAVVVGTCGSPPNTYQAGQIKPVTQDTGGRNCDALSGSIGIDQSNPGVSNGVDIAPTSAAAAALAPIVSAAAESSHVLKVGAGNLYSAYVTTGNVTGFLMVFDATAAPGDGAVTPKQCVQASANSTSGLTFQSGPPESYTTGVVLVFSSTGCSTKTASATAWFHGAVK